MIGVSPPPVDVRTADDIASHVQLLLARGVPGWPVEAPSTGAAAALIQAFARYVELVLERINRVPDRNLLAFLRQLGVSPQYARAARVPVTFTLSAGARADVVVPAGTQVSTSAAPGQEPVVFETERDLTVSTATLALAFVKDPEQDRFADRRSVLAAPADPPLSIFTGDRLIEHLLYIGHRTFFGTRPLDELRVVFDVGGGAAAEAPQAVSWELWGGSGPLPLTPSEDTTAGLTRSGSVVFKNVPRIEPSTVGVYDARWLRARLDTPISRPTVVSSIALQRTLKQDLRPDAAFANASPLDLTKDFLPFGEHPRFGDVFYLASGQAFSVE